MKKFPLSPQSNFFDSPSHNAVLHRGFYGGDIIVPSAATSLHRRGNIINKNAYARKRRRFVLNISAVCADCSYCKVVCRGEGTVIVGVGRH